MGKHTTSYRIKNEEGLYYLTFATVGWVDIFTRKRYKDDRKYYNMASDCNSEEPVMDNKLRWRMGRLSRTL